MQAAAPGAGHGGRAQCATFCTNRVSIPAMYCSMRVINSRIVSRDAAALSPAPALRRCVMMRVRRSHRRAETSCVSP
jgi:hypothetical protein